MRSRDAGATWQSLGLPVQPNSAVWTVSNACLGPDTVLAASRYGYLYRSDDGGDSWRSCGGSSARCRRSSGCPRPRERDKENPS